jgi:catechol 2,3-dioxygenase-like lactoylglutathione lyase family enzyme
MTIQRMDNVLIVVDDLEAAKAFFAELGMELEGEAPVEGRWWTASSGSTRRSACTSAISTYVRASVRIAAPDLLAGQIAQQHCP